MSKRNLSSGDAMLGRAADELGSVQDPLHEVPAGLARGYCILSSVAPALVKPSFAGSSNIPLPFLSWMANYGHFAPKPSQLFGTGQLGPNYDSV